MGERCALKCGEEVICSPGCYGEKVEINRNDGDSVVCIGGTWDCGGRNENGGMTYSIVIYILL